MTDASPPRRPAGALLSALSALGLAALIGLAMSATSLAQVVPSGATATHASTASNGQINVNIAAPNTSGISANQYSTFSAPPPGVNLINLGVNASTIVNQVTSNNASYLRGPLAVVGPTANVILANPNGIVVNGGSFINVGGVALSTGPVSYANSTTVPGYQNVVLGTGGGNILVTGAGLVGSMSSLQLIAGSIEIDGPIANTSSNANINVAAGNAQVTLDSSVVPGSTLTPWATTTALGGSSSSGILVDVTPNGSLSASRISMEVSGNGAGVSFQGHGMASIGEFSITADGKVSVLGGQIQAEKDVKVVASAIDVLNQRAQTATLASISGGVTLLANAGDINVTGQITGYQRDAADPDSQGATTLKASGDINVLSENANQLAIVFASNGDLSLTAGGNISSDTARLLSNDRVFINAGGAFSNGEDVIGAVNGGGPIVKVVKGHRFWWWPWQRSKYENVSFNFGSLRIPDQLAYVDGAEVFINAAGSVTNSGDIFAQSGALEIDAGLFEDFGIVSGSLSFSRYCGFVCKSSGISTAGAASATGDPAGLVSSAGSMQINASSKIVNDGGVILAEGNLGLNSPLITAYGLIAPQIAAFPAGLYNAFAGPTAFLYFQPVGGAFEAPNGAINITTNAPVQVNAGALQAGAGVNNAAGVNLIAPDQPTSDLANEKIGIFHRIW